MMLSHVRCASASLLTHCQMFQKIIGEHWFCVSGISVFCFSHGFCTVRLHNYTACTVNLRELRSCNNLFPIWSTNKMNTYLCQFGSQETEYDARLCKLRHAYFNIVSNGSLTCLQHSNNMNPVRVYRNRYGSFQIECVEFKQAS